jgi:hypothetical protein
MVAFLPEGARNFLMEAQKEMNYVGPLSQTLEQRVEELEKKVAELRASSIPSTRPKNPWRTFGIFQNDPDFEEAVRLGRE